MQHGIISAPQPEAVEAGALILRAGGNAVDAGIACALTQGVVDPLMCGLGGVGTALVHVPGAATAENFNFLGAAPRAASEDIWSDRIIGETGDGFGFILEDNVNALGHQAAMVPGNLAGYFAMHQAHGRLEWSELCQHAIESAASGWMVRPQVYAYATQDEGAAGRVHNSDILGFSEQGRALYLASDGQMHRPGTWIKNPGLADTLEQIAKEGADALYGGDIGQRLCADMAANGGLITLEDLREYRVARSPALTGSYRDLELATNQPGGSGLQVLLTLNILEQFNLDEYAFGSPEHLALLAEALTYAYDRKRAEVGDPQFVDVPVAELLDKRLGAEIAGRIRGGELATLNRLPQSMEAKGTTHISVYDCDGQAFSMTHTLGAPSGVMPPGCGFILNGCMGIFDPRPGKPTSIQPGKSYTSSMSPVIGYRDKQPCLVVGAPGATYIPQAVAQVIVNGVDFGMSIGDAIAAPRIAVTQSRRIDLSNRIPRFVEKELIARGYQTLRSHLSYAFAGVHGITVNEGVARGSADPGRDGMALTV
jgi:gamma-glutamyltranspeptidase/glutathione hydrolase